MQDFGPTYDPLSDPVDSERFIPIRRTVDEGRTEDGAQPFVGCMAHSEPAAFWRLWEQYRTELYRCCLRWMGGDPHEAKEALHSVALKALHELPRHGHEISNYKYWLTRLAYNLCMDMRRGHRRYAKNAACLEDYAEINSDAVARVSEQPEQMLLQYELRMHLQHAIVQLPPRLREPFLLRFVEGLPCQDIAQQLALTPENVRKRLQHARAFVRNELLTYLSADNDDLKFTNSHLKTSYEYQQHSSHRAKGGKSIRVQ